MNSTPAGALPLIVPRNRHTIQESALSTNAVKVILRLKEAGYQAFLVGGSVRDLLLGLRPKDFDVATSASPEEVKDLFRNCRLIGRRFRLAHVFFGRDIIEVATFRAAHDAESEPRDEDEWRENVEDSERVLDARGRILRDNVYGTVEEDVWRRDFTANALYYDVQEHAVWDFTGGFEDVQARRLRLIGDPVTRYHEDPVRMLRAVRFAAKLGFTLDAATEEPLRKLAYLLTHVPPARLFDEVLKLFLGGFGAKSLALLRQYNLLAPLLPLTEEYLQRDENGAFAQLLMRGLEGTDARVAVGKPVTPTFLFALLLYGAITDRTAKEHAEGQSDSHAAFAASESAVSEQQKRVMIPRRFVLPMREMFAMQPRFRRREGKKALSLIVHPRFRAAYDLLLLRAAVGAEEQEVADWWTEIQTKTQEEREALVTVHKQQPSSPDAPSSPPRKRRRRRRRAPRVVQS